MTETLPDNRVLHAKEYSRRTQLYHTARLPGVVLRRPKSEAEISDPRLSESDRKFAELLIDLDENYGIRSPGIRAVRPEEHPETPSKFYIGGDWVKGKNLYDKIDEVPAPAARQALEAIIAYYRDATENGGAYLGDVRPSNIIYGRTAKDHEDHLYFVDIGPEWSNFTAGDHLEEKRLKGFMDYVMPELWLLIHDGITRGEDWQDLLAAYDSLNASQHSFTKAA